MCVGNVVLFREEYKKYEQKPTFFLRSHPHRLQKKNQRMTE